MAIHSMGTKGSAKFFITSTGTDVGKPSCVIGGRHSRAGLDLHQLINKIRDGDTICVQDNKKGVATFFGTTGWGKSTTIDFLCGATIISIPKPGSTRATVLDVCESERQNFIPIGHAKRSETKGIKLIKAGDMFLCDMPGSSDTDPVDDIVNCILRSKALLLSKEVRPVLVLAFKEKDSNRGQAFLDAIEYVAQCFDSDKYFGRISVLVTHVPEQVADIDAIALVQECLSEILNDSKDNEAKCSRIGTALLNHLAERFKRAEMDLEEGEENISAAIGVVRPLKSESRERIYNLIIRNLSISDPQKSFKFTMSDAAKKSLALLYEEHHERIAQLFVVLFSMVESF